MPSYIGDQSNNRVLPNMLGGLKKATQQSSVATYYDLSNRLRVVIGAIASALGPTYATTAGSDFGLAVQDPLGNVHEVNPASSGGLNGPVSTTSTTPADLGAPEVSFWIGATGAAIVLLSAFTSTTVSNQSAFCGISWDGGAAGTNLAVSAGGTPIGVSASATLVQSTLGAGEEHTAKPLFWGSDGNSVTFSEISLVVWPI